MFIKFLKALTTLLILGLIIILLDSLFSRVKQAEAALRTAQGDLVLLFNWHKEAEESNL